MRISVIIPVYNRRHALLRAIDSVAAQTFAPIETIVVDDGSTDGGARWAKTQFPWIEVIDQPQQGVSVARNTGVQAAAGEWVAFLDSDDAWMPDKLARQVKSLLVSEEVPLCHTDEFWIRNGRRVNPMRKHAKYSGWIFDHCLPRCAISPSSVLMSKALFHELGGFDESLPAAEDYDLWLRVCCRYPVLLVAEPLVSKYGGHADQLSRKYWGMDRFRVASLERLSANGALTSAQRLKLIDVLIEKLSVLENGARKRGKTGWATGLRRKIHRYRRERASLAPTRAGVQPIDRLAAAGGDP